MPVTDATDLVSSLNRALNSFDWTQVEVISREIAAGVMRTPGFLPETTAKTVLSKLRRKQCFGSMTLLAESFIQAGLRTPQIQRQYAQALIDQGLLTPSESLLRSIIQDPAGITAEEFEARGLVGRIYKQLYVNRNDPKSPTNQANLERALKEYLYVYRLDPKEHLWHGINVVALSARAERDGLPVSGLPDAKSLAQEIRVTVDEKEAKSTKPLECWDLAIRLEACIAMGETTDCLNTALTYVESDDADAFEINSTYRQLTEIWQLNQDEPPGNQLLPILKAGHLKKRGGGIDHELQNVKEERKKVDEAVKDLQAIFGSDRMVTLKWYRKGLDQCNSVGRVEKLSGKGHGTGWLVKADDFFPGRTGKLLLTNNHVITDRPDPFNNPLAITPDNAKVNFQALGNEQLYDLGEVVWSSKFEEFDAAFVTIKGDPPGNPLVIHASSPTMSDPPPRLYIIGHPGGRDLEISLQDNYLLACNDRLLHYRTPTEKGSSGSPVFEPEDWRVVALHHKGSSSLDRIDGKAGTYEANEGIAILAIKNSPK